MSKRASKEFLETVVHCAEDDSNEDKLDELEDELADALMEVRGGSRKPGRHFMVE
jgi:hypothetical protein